MNSHKSPMLNDLAGLDPERETTLNVHTDPQAQAILSTVLDSDLSVPNYSATEAQDEKLVPNKLPASAETAHPRRRVSYLVGAAAGVAALAVGLTLFSPDTPNAFASWTPRAQNLPTGPLLPGDPARANEICASMGDDNEPIDDLEVNRYTDNVIAERRGDFELRVMVDPTPGRELLQFCANPTGETKESLIRGDTELMMGMWKPSGDGTVGDAIRAELAPEDVIMVDRHAVDVVREVPLTPEGLKAEPKVDATYESVMTANTAVGRLGQDVSAITFNLADGTQVEANIENGWWTAWWPHTLGAIKDATVTTSQGTKTIKL